VDYLCWFETMEQLAAGRVTSNSDEVYITAPDVVQSSSPVNLESYVSSMHSSSRLSERRWSAPDDCSIGSDSVEASQQYSHSADVVPSKRISDWETVESDVNLQPATHLMYSGVSSRASPQHNVLLVLLSVFLFNWPNFPAFQLSIAGLLKIYFWEFFEQKFLLLNNNNKALKATASNQFIFFISVAYMLIICTVVVLET